MKRRPSPRKDQPSDKETDLQIDDYPETVTEVLDEDMVFPQEVLRVVGNFANSKPWSGRQDDRKAKFLRLNRDLAKAFSISAPMLEFGLLDGTSSGGSHYSPSAHCILITGRLSVVTFLHEFGHACGLGERETCRWSVNLFRRCFPRQFSRLIQHGHMLLRPADAAARAQ
jgi:hypothetical protein